MSSRTPYTAGKIIKESELRAYTKCSQFYFYGGTYTPTLQLKALQGAFERSVSDTIRRQKGDVVARMTYNIVAAVKALPESRTLLEGQIEGIVQKTTLAMREIFNFFSFDTYAPVMGALPYVVKIRKTPVELVLSGTFRTKKNKTLHAVVFTPYNSTHAMQNDVVTHLKLQSLRGLVKPHHRRPQAKLHMFGISDSGQLTYTSAYSNTANENHIKQIENVVRQMENGYHFPLIPCQYSCKYKQICKPGD